MMPARLGLVSGLQGVGAWGPMLTGMALAVVLGTASLAPAPAAAAPETSEPQQSPVRWAAPWPDVKKPAAGFPLLEGVEHFTVFRAAKATGIYNHHAHLLHHGGTFFALWSNHDHGEDGPGQRVLGAISRDGRRWSPPVEVFPPQGPSGDAEGRGRVMTANGLLLIDGTAYAVGEVHDNVGFTDAAAKVVVPERGARYYARARRGWGRLARSIAADGTLGPAFWLVDDPPEPLPGFPAYPGAADPRFAEPAARINRLQQEPLGRPYWDFRASNAGGRMADAYQTAVDGHTLCEPTTYRRPDGVFVRLFRDRDHSHRLYAATSRDGREWTTPQPTNVPDSPSRTHTGSLPDGRVFMLGNQLSAPPDVPDKPRHYTRDPLVLSLSSDGRVFDFAAAVRAGAPAIRLGGKGKGRGFQYPYGVVAGDALWVIYSIGKEDIGISHVPLGSLPGAAGCRDTIRGQSPDEGPATPPASAFVRVSPRDRSYFELSDGSPYIPIGLNMIAPRGNLDEDEGLAVMRRWIERLAANRGNYLRLWLAHPFWDVEHDRAGEYDEAKARRLDAVLKMARQHGVRVKMTIEHFREIDPDSGYNKTIFLKSLHHVSRGGTARSMAEWLAGEPSRAQFCRKLDWYAARYGDDPTVFGWELWNEGDCVRGGDYLDWTEAMLDELKRRFPRNLAMHSFGSFDHPGKRDRYWRLARLPGNDVAQVHRYLDLGAAMEVCYGPVDVLAAEAVREMLAAGKGGQAAHGTPDKPGTLAKPVILAETGAVEPRHSGPSKLYEKDKAGIILHDVLFAPFFAGAAGPGQCWHWAEYVDRNDLWHHFARFAAAVEDLDPPAERFHALMVDHPRLRVYALIGKRTTLLWCRDRENTWQTELADEKPPRPIRGATIELTRLTPPPNATVCTYDPWTDQRGSAVLDGNTLRLPDFTRSVVVRIVRRQGEGGTERQRERRTPRPPLSVSPSLHFAPRRHLARLSVCGKFLWRHKWGFCRIWATLVFFPLSRR